MKSYVLVRTTVHDPAAFERYRALAGPSIRAHGGELMLKGAVLEALEGTEDHERVAMIGFPTEEVARAWFASDAYQEAILARKEVATMALTLVRAA